MNYLDSNSIGLIKKACKNKTGVKMTVGYLSDENIDIHVFNEFGEMTTDQLYTYEIGSITKTFTASLFAKLLSEKKMSLDDSIQAYISGLEDKQYYPTLRRLATHSAGYPARYPLNQWEFIKMSKDIFIGGKTQENNPLQIEFNKTKELVRNTKLKDIDYKWKYSNFGVSLLGYAIGSATGGGYWEVMTDFITNELGLQHTYLGTRDNKNLRGFSVRREVCKNWKWDKNNPIAPASALSSTAKDLLLFAKLNMDEEKKYLSLCHKKYANGTKKYDMGLAWWLDKASNHNIIMHTGGTGCFSSCLIIDKNKKIATVVLVNYRLGIDLGQTIGFSMLENLQKSMII